MQIMRLKIVCKMSVFVGRMRKTWPLSGSKCNVPFDDVGYECQITPRASSYLTYGWVGVDHEIGWFMH